MNFVYKTNIVICFKTTLKSFHFIQLQEDELDFIVKKFFNKQMEVIVNTNR